MRTLAPLRQMAWLLAIGLLATLADAPVAAAPPVEGDAAALKQFRESLRTNEKVFPHGRITFRSRGKHASSKGGVLEESAEGELTWSGNRERWDVVKTGSGSDPTKPPHKSEVLLIRDDDDFFSYLKPRGDQSKGTVKISAGYKISLGPTFEYFSPSKWQMYEGDSRFPWASKVDPAAAGPLTEKFVVTREGQEVRIVEHFPKFPAAVVVGSFAHGGNVVSYDWPGIPDPPPKTVSWTSRGSYEWAQTSDELWYPKKIHFLRFRPEHPEDVKLDVSFEITEFDPKQPDESLFDVRHVELSPGTSISAFGRDFKDRKRRVTTDSQEENAELLESLAAEVGADDLVSE